MNCLECKKPLDQTGGKREKKFCNNTCRSKYWQKSRSKTPKHVLWATHQAALEENKKLKNELAILRRNKLQSDETNANTHPKENNRNLTTKNQSGGGVHLNNLTENKPKTNYTIYTTAEIKEKIENATISMNSCWTSGLGKKAKESYQREINYLKTLQPTTATE